MDEPEQLRCVERHVGDVIDGRRVEVAREVCKHDRIAAETALEQRPDALVLREKLRLEHHIGRLLRLAFGPLPRLAVGRLARNAGFFTSHLPAPEIDLKRIGAARRLPPQRTAASTWWTRPMPERIDRVCPNQTASRQRLSRRYRQD